jgi:hypothetical protein
LPTFGNVREKKRQCASRQYSSERITLSLFVGELSVDFIIGSHFYLGRLYDAQRGAAPVEDEGLQPDFGQGFSFGLVLPERGAGSRLGPVRDQGTELVSHLRRVAHPSATYRSSRAGEYAGSVFR